MAKLKKPKKLKANATPSEIKNKIEVVKRYKAKKAIKSKIPGINAQIDKL